MLSGDPVPRSGPRLVLRALLGGVLITLLTAGAVATAGLMEVKSVADALDDAPPVFDTPEVADRLLDDVEPGGPQTLVLLGSDARYIDRKLGNPVRSDTIILVRLDPSKGATTMLSLPRDLIVDIPGVGRDKINAAYSAGGPEKTVETLKALLGGVRDDGTFPVSHVVNVNFGGFARAVDRLGCLYLDIDREYFNDNDPPTGGGGNYATIDIDAGYQKVCGQDALDFVRHRHLDSDLVRGARQQELLRAAKDQIGVSRIINDRDELIRVLKDYTQTDIRSVDAILRLAKLVVQSSSKPIQEVQFQGTLRPDGAVEVSDAQLRRIVSRFMDAKATPGKRGTERKTSSRKATRRQRRRARRAGLPPGVIDARRANEDAGVRLGTKARLDVVYPKAQLGTAVLDADDSRAYTIRTRTDKRYAAYRMVFRTNEAGQNYGVQGTTWTAPPILDDPRTTITRNGRKLQVFYDGDRIRLVAWKRRDAVYWVSNTLLQTLTNRQMLAIAGSLTRVGSG